MSGANTLGSARSYNSRVSGYDASHLRPNPRFARTSHIPQPLYEIVTKGICGVEIFFTEIIIMYLHHILT